MMADVVDAMAAVSPLTCACARPRTGSHPDATLHTPFWPSLQAKYACNAQWTGASSYLMNSIQRAIVIGTSGAGKTTFARQLARRIATPHTELDALYWGPGWTPVPTEQFLAAVGEATAGDRWVLDGNYSVARDLIWPRATHIVWLDYGRVRTFTQVLRRTLQRGIVRQPLWAGNRESLRNAFFSRDSILLWSLQTFDKNRRRYAALAQSGAWPQAQWVVLRSPQEARCWLAEQAAVPNAPDEPSKTRPP